MKFKATTIMAGSTAIALLAVSGPAWAQEAPSAASGANPALEETQEILVTARRRSEAALDVPAVITAFSGEALDKAGVLTFSDIGRMTPQLTIEPNVGSYGGTITLRGVASPSSNPSSEPAVTINIDGVPVAVGAAVRLGQLDLGQVEILKGPQALFFGKNAIGGIISLRSAEPTDEFEVMARVGYETKARQIDSEVMVSGPISDQLRGRIAARYSTQRGYFTNDVVTARDPRGPGTESVGLRGTLIFEPSSDFTLKVKGIYDEMEEDGGWYVAQRLFCPSGTPAGPAASPLYPDCKADSHVTRGDLPANASAASGNPLFRDGVPYSHIRQYLGVADISYRGISGIEITAITGYYNLATRQADNNSTGVVPALFSAGATSKRTWSQELRFASDTPDSPLSWMFGGFYQRDHFIDDEQAGLVLGPLPVYRPRAIYDIHGRTWSGFAQASYTFFDKLTLSAGARYTDERKRQTVNTSTKFIPSISFENLSPEFTLSFKPTSNTNIYASYKEGYQAGGFQVGSLNFIAPIGNPAVTTIDNSYDQETVNGFEAGVKTSLFSGSLRLDLAAYSYVYNDLQLSSFDPVLNVTRIANATSAKVRGAEFSFNYSPLGMRNFKLSGAMAYNRSRYDDFISACYVGQTIAMGCAIDGPDAGSVPDMQDLSGRTLPRAPKWAANLGFNYDAEVGANLTLGLNGQAIYQSKTFLSQELVPYGTSGKRTTFDGSISLGDRNKAWEIALIGKNLTNKFYGVSGFQVPFTGAAASTGTNVGVLPDYGGVVSRGRQLWIRFTLRPTSL